MMKVKTELPEMSTEYINIMNLKRLHSWTYITLKWIKDTAIPEREILNSKTCETSK